MYLRRAPILYVQSKTYILQSQSLLKKNPPILVVVTQSLYKIWKCIEIAFKCIEKLFGIIGVPHSQKMEIFK